MWTLPTLRRPGLGQQLRSGIDDKGFDRPKPAQVVGMRRALRFGLFASLCQLCAAAAACAARSASARCARSLRISASRADTSAAALPLLTWCAR